MNCLRVVIAGTGTGVGKTYVAERLLSALHGRLPVVGLKPIESGCVDGLAADAALLSQACGASRAPLYAFRAPVSPHMAAEGEQCVVSLAAVSDWVVKSEQESAARISVVETAGGLCSPLAIDGQKAVTNLDLLRQLEPDVWVLVAADRLGALHDVEVVRLAAAVHYRRADAIVLTEAAAPSSAVAELGNARELRRWCSEDVLSSASGGLSQLAENLLARSTR